MNFDYSAYKRLLTEIKANGYNFADYTDYKKYKKSVILRHDIDFSIKNAIRVSQIEYELLGKENKAVYFVLVSTNFYNIFSRESKEYLKEIMECGGEIGLHFDETQYNINTEQELKKYIEQEKKVLQDIIERKISVVSMHRPSKKFLASEIKLENMINAYSKEFFNDMKYISDSRRNWKENVEKIIAEKEYARLHILTHPIWYTEEEKKDIKQAVWDEIIGAMEEKYLCFKNNISNFDSVIDQEDVVSLSAKIKEE